MKSPLNCCCRVLLLWLFKVWFSSELKVIADRDCEAIQEFRPGHFFTPDTGLVAYYTPVWRDVDAVIDPQLMQSTERVTRCASNSDGKLDSINPQSDSSPDSAAGGAPHKVPDDESPTSSSSPATRTSSRTPSPSPSWPDVLVQAVRRQCMSDVPFGLLLSGGIDSAICAAILKPVRLLL